MISWNASHSLGRPRGLGLGAVEEIADPVGGAPPEGWSAVFDAAAFSAWPLPSVDPHSGPGEALEVAAFEPSDPAGGMAAF